MNKVRTKWPKPKAVPSAVATPALDKTGYPDLSRRQPPYGLFMKLQRLKDRCYQLRLEIDNDGYYNDISGHLGDAEMALYQAQQGNVWRNPFHQRGPGKPSDSPYRRKK